MTRKLLTVFNRHVPRARLEKVPGRRH